MSTEIPAIRLQVYRLNNGEGIGIFAQSEMLEQFFRKVATNPDSTSKSNFNAGSTPGWSSHLGYKLPPKDEFKFFNMWGQNILQGNSANISFLTAKGLGKGITLELEGIYNQGTVEKFLLAAKRQLKQLWQDSIKEGNCALICDYREIE